MLAGLDSVPWAELEVAGVSDELIPDLLRTMATADEQTAIDAFHDLQWEILHQGSVYSATAPVVPFLAELLTSVGPTLRAAIVHILGDLAHAYEIDPEEPERVEARAAVTAAVDRLLPLLAHDDPWTRYVAAYALSGCPDRAEDVQEGLRRRWEVETDPRVRAGVVMAAAELNSRTTLISEGLAVSQAPVVRAAAVLAAVRTGRRWPGAKAVAAVRAAWRDGDPFAVDEDGRWGPPDWYPEAMDDLVGNLKPTDQAPILTALLGSEDPDVRMRAAIHAGTAIGLRRSLREPLAAILVPSLDDDDPRVRLAAADAIRGAGAAAAHHADALAAAADRDDEAGGQAVAALAELGDRRADNRLAAHLRAGTAADDLGIVLAGVPATPELLDAVRHRLAALAGNAPDRREITAIRDIRQQVRHTDPEPLGLLRLVRAWGPAAAPAVGEVVGLLSSGRAGTEAANALAAIGPAAADVLPPNDESIGDSAVHNENQLALARARWRLTGDPRPAIEMAWRHITHNGADIPAIALLIEIGEPARALLPRMRQARADWLTEAPEWYQSERVAVARLIWEWTGDPEEALPVARRFLDNLDDNVIGYGPVEAAILAVDLGQTDAVPTLTGMLADGRPFTQRLRAYRALWRLTGDPDLVLPPLTELVTAESPPGAEPWTELLHLLTELGPAAAPILPTLREIADRDEHVVTFWPGQTPGVVDEQVRTAIRALCAT
jgi:HEAT repeat protein